MTAWGQILPLKSLTSLGIVCIQKTTGFCRGWICKVCIIVAAWSGILELAIKNYACPGTTDKTFNIYTRWKKSLTEMAQSPDTCAGLSAALLCSLEWVPWIILRQVFHCKLAELLDPSLFAVAVRFPNPWQPHWRNTAMGCDYDSADKDHWTFRSNHPAIWL